MDTAITARALRTEEVGRRAAQLEVEKRLQDSGYPLGLTKRQLRRVLVPTPRSNKEWIGTTVIPYKTGTSEVIRRVDGVCERPRSAEVIRGGVQLSAKWSGSKNAKSEGSKIQVNTLPPNSKPIVSAPFNKHMRTKSVDDTQEEYSIKLSWTGKASLANKERNSFITDKRVNKLQGTSSYLKSIFDIDPGCLIGVWWSSIVIDRASMECLNTNHRRPCFCGMPNTRLALLN
ncbi:hypothetical protein CLF_109167 [Clonorchis sinensis]|uniref:Uncharacterized protein n=1 Tax=Clonorchis sinensis TaxID=79923 RepID=G7YJ16_CLOSI|nr:hypothetical protein CLF_109167 [Clonorchis sinensis]